MAQYQVTIRVPIEALDDIEARKAMKALMIEPISSIQTKAVIKLQRLEEDRAPIGIHLIQKDI